MPGWGCWIRSGLPPLVSAVVTEIGKAPAAKLCWSAKLAVRFHYRRPPTASGRFYRAGWPCYRQSLPESSRRIHFHVSAPESRRRWISALDSPNTRCRISSVSAPNSGAARWTRHGVPDMVQGMPVWIRCPTSGCSKSGKKPRCARCGSSARSLLLMVGIAATPAACRISVISQRSRCEVQAVMIASSSSSLRLRICRAAKARVGGE